MSLLSLSAAKELLGLSPAYFDRYIRPQLTLYSRGNRSVGVVREQLLEVYKEYLEANRIQDGKEIALPAVLGDNQWQSEKHHPESGSKTQEPLRQSGTSIRRSREEDTANHLLSLVGTS